MKLNPPKVARCRVCGNPTLRPCISLGVQYVSSVFPVNLAYGPDVPELPLDLVMCDASEPGVCGLVQLGHHLDLSAMYEAYPYTSATNSSMGGILRDVAESGRNAALPQPADVVLDIGCNDGTLLSFFAQDEFTLIGIDPAKNVVAAASGARYQHVREFFSAKAYFGATSRRARLIFSIAMFYHLADPVAFAREVAECLAADGVWIIQMAYLPAMLRTNMYDNIVHEHAGYYATHHMQWVMEKAGLEIFDVELNDVYGGSFRVFVKQKGCDRFPKTEHLARNVQSERDSAIFALDTYLAFERRIRQTRDDLRLLCRRLKSEGKSVWVYGASTKGNTILQYCDLGKDEIVAAADANPFKLGKFLVGSNIPITDEATMRSARPDYLLALPYSFVDAFVRREAELVSKGVKFIVPLPEVRLLP